MFDARHLAKYAESARCKMRCNRSMRCAVIRARQRVCASCGGDNAPFRFHFQHERKCHGDQYKSISTDIFSLKIPCTGVQWGDQGVIVRLLFSVSMSVGKGQRRTACDVGQGKGGEIREIFDVQRASSIGRIKALRTASKRKNSMRLGVWELV